MENPVSPLTESSETAKEDRFFTDGSDDEGALFKEKSLSDSMSLPNQVDLGEEGASKGGWDGEQRGAVIGVENGGGEEKTSAGGLASLKSLMQETKEIELSPVSRPAGDIDVRVEAPKKSSEGMGGHLVYPIITTTSMGQFRNAANSPLVTSRRFNDFLTLYENLVSTHQSHGVIIPLPPEKDVIGMTKMKISKEEEVNSMDFVEKRRAALERFLKRIADHPKLVTDKSFVTFLQDDGEYAKVGGTASLAGGLAKWLGKVGEGWSKYTSGLCEDDQWYEDRQELMESTEHHLKELLTCAEALLLQRKELATATTQLSKAVANLGSTEEDLSLSKVLSSLSEAIDRTEKLKSMQKMQSLLDTIRDNLSFIAALRLSMNERNRLHKCWKDSEATLAKKEEQKVKLEMSKKTDKLEYASMEIHEWEEKVGDNKKAFEEISENIKKETKRLDQTRVKELRAVVYECLHSNADMHRQVASVWEALIPQVSNQI